MRETNTNEHYLTIIL